MSGTCTGTGVAADAVAPVATVASSTCMPEARFADTSALPPTWPAPCDTSSSKAPCAISAPASKPSPRRNRLPGEQRRDGHRVDRWCAVGSGREVRKAEAVPARRGPVVDLSEQGCAAGGEGDVEGAVGGDGEVRFAYPAAQEVLDGCGLGGGVGVGMLQEAEGCAAWLHCFWVPGPPDFRATGLLLGNGLGRRCQGLRVVRAGLVGVAVRGGCGVQDCSSGGVSEWEACGVESPGAVASIELGCSATGLRDQWS